MNKNIEREAPMDAREWIISDMYEVPDRMPNINALYSAGATYVSVEEYNEKSGQMILNITFPCPSKVAETTELWLHIANSNHDGVKLNSQLGHAVDTGYLNVKMLILGHDEYIDKQAKGSYYTGGIAEW